MATTANQRLISIRNIIIYLETKFRPNRRIFVFWRPFWIQNGRHSKPMMDINSKHYNLLGSQISSQSEDFCTLAPFWIQNGRLANQRWISIHNIIIYLEIKFRHSKPEWLLCGAACLTSCKCPFPLKSFHFWIFSDFFILAAILKIPRPECTSWDGDPPSCEI
jgi:hypothetical protein